jgi:hypothetical protein
MIPVIYPNYYPEQINYSKRNNAAIIVTTKVGTFSSTWKGSGTLYFDPGDGGSIEPLVLTAGGVAWTHGYLLVGSKTIKITGDLSGVTTMSAPIQNVLSLSGVVSLTSLEQFSFYGNQISNFPSFGSIELSYINISNCNISSVENISNLYGMGLFYINDNTITYPLTGIDWFVATFGNYRFYSTVSTSEEVGQWLIDLSRANWSNCTVRLDGTNPAPPSTQEVTDAIAMLAGNGVTLYVST